MSASRVAGVARAGGGGMAVFRPRGLLPVAYGPRVRGPILAGVWAESEGQPTTAHLVGASQLRQPIAKNDHLAGAEGDAPFPGHRLPSGTVVGAEAVA